MISLNYICMVRSHVTREARILTVVGEAIQCPGMPWLALKQALF